MTGEQLLALKAQIMTSASGKAGTHGVVTDNSGALEVFGS